MIFGKQFVEKLEEIKKEYIMDEKEFFDSLVADSFTENSSKSNQILTEQNSKNENNIENYKNERIQCKENDYNEQEYDEYSDYDEGQEVQVYDGYDDIEL